ncbi:MAG: energy-coupling factor ABC transporter ATP-binding protein [Thermofilum sp. ex4484_15]|nr:MAG: energy-coupling factor ABC transporter ATP-binding protein [Thermofilum sp. ex4484_15]
MRTVLKSNYAIEVINLSFKYEGTEEYALNNVNLRIKEGEYVVITGPSGSGKSTLCRTLNGLIPHFYRGHMEGDIRIFGISTRAKRTHELARLVGMVFQESENQLFLSSVEREIAFGLENLGLPRDYIRKRVKWALRNFKLEGLKDKAPYELSGGQQQKVAIASVMAMSPRILVLDEPTSNLDPLSAFEIIALIHQVNKAMGVTVILVEHRLELALKYATRLILMKEGRVITDGDPREVITSKEARSLGIGIPKVVEVYKRLKEEGIELPRIPLSSEELALGVRGCLATYGSSYRG